MSVKTYGGSCHCGTVRFEADIDLAAGTGKCNCTYCAKVRNWSVNIKPDAFRLLSGADALGDYRFGTLSSSHSFCRHCGIHTFTRGHVEEIGGDFVSIAVSSLDIDPGELIAAPVHYADGLNNAWWETPAETRHL